MIIARSKSIFDGYVTGDRTIWECSTISEAMEGRICLLYGLCEVVLKRAKIERSPVKCAAKTISSEFWAKERSSQPAMCSLGWYIEGSLNRLYV